MKDYSNITFPKKAIFRRNPLKTYSSSNFKNGQPITYVSESDHATNALGYRWYKDSNGTWGLVHYTELQ